jgi:hypothetical protein
VDDQPRQRPRRCARSPPLSPQPLGGTGGASGNEHHSGGAALGAVGHCVTPVGFSNRGAGPASLSREYFTDAMPPARSKIELPCWRIEATVLAPTTLVHDQNGCTLQSGDQPEKADHPAPTQPHHPAGTPRRPHASFGSRSATACSLASGAISRR